MPFISVAGKVHKISQTSLIVSTKKKRKKEKPHKSTTVKGETLQKYTKLD
jgi:hypothetical protein